MNTSTETGLADGIVRLIEQGEQADVCRQKGNPSTNLRNSNPCTGEGTSSRSPPTAELLIHNKDTRDVIGRNQVAETITAGQFSEARNGTVLPGRLRKKAAADQTKEGRKTPERKADNTGGKCTGPVGSENGVSPQRQQP